MGGGAFAQSSAQGEPTLNTPRMTPAEYANLKMIFIQKLQSYFPGSKVACLTEAPEKPDYGDMDILVALDQRVNFNDMANHVGAAGIIHRSSGNVQQCSLGVLKDGTASHRAAVVYKLINGDAERKRQPSTVVTDQEYAQIDVEIVPTELLDWFSFYSSYGDMAGLLGHIVHNLGFTISDRGLWIRMKELDFSKTVQYLNIADKEGLMFVSRDPSQVMRFLGLSVQEYEAGFNTLDSLYEWLGACRLLSTEAIKTKRDNAHERRREQKRPVFSKFFFEWLPKHMNLETELDEDARRGIIKQLRQKHLEEAIDFFSLREEYNAKHNALLLKFNNATAANLLRPLIAKHSNRQDKQLNEIVRAFRRYVVFQPDRQPCVSVLAHTDEESQLHLFLSADGMSLHDERATSRWVEEHWEELRALERERVKAIVRASGS